ncbi:MAG TPA: DUF3810 domain-containing protein [Vicinamibacteria bacterium]|nr:DUF3810 domain-containing protein [Vicinamibacteria bacterium]
MRSATIAAALWACVLVARTAASRRPAVVEDLYARRLYPAVARAVSVVTGRLPFSLAEVGVVVGLVAILILSVRFVVTWKRRARRPLRLRMARLAAAAAAVVLAFDLLWGFNYDRQPVSTLLHYDVSPGRPEDLAALARDLIAAAVRLREGLPEDEHGVLRLADGRGGALERARLGFAGKTLEQRLPLPVMAGRPKLVFLSPAMSYLGIAGIFIPFTGEANVNSTLPEWEIPFTAAHELAHQRGFAREEEANYVGYLACRAHPDRDFQYSGVFRASLYALAALAHVDGEAYGRLRGGLSDALRRDLAALAAWHLRYASRLSDVQERVNDTYLKTQGQAQGVQSYGQVVDLLLAERRTAAAGMSPSP